MNKQLSFNIIIIISKIFIYKNNYDLILLMYQSRQKQYQKSKCYPGFDFLSLTINRDCDHQKLWNQKQQQAYQALHKRRIDKMLNCIIKERMFGSLISDSKILSASGHHTLDTINKEQVNRRINPQRSSFLSRYQTNKKSTIDDQIYNPINLNTPKISRTLVNPSQSSKKHLQERYSTYRNSSIDDQTYDNVNLTIPKISRTIMNSSQSEKKHLRKKSFSKSVEYRKKSINNCQMIPVKQLNTSKIPQFLQFFRKLINNATSLVHNIKITKQNLLAYAKNFIDITVMEKFLYFFNFPTTMSYKQYCYLVEIAVNCPLKDIHFFIFQILDQSITGILTVNDLFKAIQLFPNNPYIEKQIYAMAEFLSKLPKQKYSQKPTVEQLLITNQNLKIEQYRDLIQQENHELKPTNYLKSTCYNHSILALQHYSKFRLKQDQIQNSKAENKKDKIKNDTSNISGIRVRDYFKFMNGRRPKMFCSIIAILTGQNSSDYE